MSEDQWVHSEADLTEQLGLPRGDVRQVRSDSLEQGKDWKHVRGAVRYSLTGWKKLCAQLKISPPKAPAAAPGPDSAPNTPRRETVFDLVNDGIGNAAEDKAAYIQKGPLPKNPGEIPPTAALPRLVATTRLGPGARHELVCAKIYLNNPRIVQARFGQVLVRVRVKDSANITPGLAMQCTWIEGDLWQLATRLPRWKGKW